MIRENTLEQVRERVDIVYRSDSRRVLAILIRLLGDFDLAEDALHDAFTAALEQWPREGVPVNPRAWLVSAGRFKAIDALLVQGDLADYHLAHSARADLCRRLGRTEEARTSYHQALRLARQEPEQRFLRRRLCCLPD